MVSKAEVLEAIERIKKIGARVTVDGVKFRVYTGLVSVRVHFVDGGLQTLYPWS